MDVKDAVTQRRSVRAYSDRDIAETVLKKILDTARFAPSASNRQEWRFVAVRDKTKKMKLAEAARNQQFVATAPVVLACCALTDHHVMTCSQKCYPIDLAIIIDHITLLAVEEGIGSCWIGAFYEEQVKKILDIPEDVRVVELLTLGYPADTPNEKTRLSLSEIVFEERWTK
jgi:nitroreductase